jgi:hypothetical protein
MYEHFRTTRFLKTIRLYRLICSLSAVFVLWGCGGSGSGTNNDIITNGIESQGASNVNGELLFVVDNIPGSLADSMSVMNSEAGQSYPTNTNYSYFDRYKQAAFERYNGLEDRATVTAENAGYFTILATGGPFDDTVGKMDSEQPLSWQQMSEIMARLIARISNPGVDFSSSNLCSVGYVTWVQDELVVDGISVDGTSFEFVGCKLVFSTATLSGSLAGFTGPLNQDRFNEETRTLAAADELVFSSGIQNLSVTGVEYWYSQTGCIGEGQGISNFHIRNVTDGREVLLVDRITKGESYPSFGSCSRTIDLVKQHAGYVYDSTHGYVEINTDGNLFERKEGVSLHSLSRRRNNDIEYNLGSQLHIEGANDTSAELEFVTTGDREIDITIASIKVKSGDQVHTELSSSLEDFNYSTMISDSDTDADGMTDTWELLYGLNPSDPSDANADADFDGLMNSLEYEFFGNPTNSKNGILYDRGVSIRGSFPQYSTHESSAPLGITVQGYMDIKQSSRFEEDNFKLNFSLIGPARLVAYSYPDICTPNEDYSGMECDFSTWIPNPLEFKFRPLDQGEITIQAEITTPAYDVEESNNIARITVAY